MCIQGLITFTTAIFSSVTIFHILIESDDIVECFSCCEIVKIWFKACWKMRSIYMCVVVHIFDFTTDLTVIRQWFMAESVPPY